MDMMGRGKWFAAASAMAVMVAAGALATRPAGGGINGGGRYYGAIDQFGSIFVNGVEFGLGGASITIDGRAASEAELRLGQLVTVDGVVNLDGVTGNAISVSVSNAVRGPVSALEPAAAGFTILGQAVRVDAGTLYGTGLSPQGYAGVKLGDAYVVSGHRNARGEIEATRIDRATSQDSRAVGTVAGLQPDASRFALGALTVDYAGAQVSDTLADGVTAQVEGVLAAPDLVLATRVQVEDDSLPAGEGASLEGYVTGALLAGRFVLGSQPIAIDAGTQFVDGTLADLLVGAKLEAEGRVDSQGVLQASKLTFDWPDPARAHGLVTRTPANGGWLEVDGLVIETPVGTAFEDRSDAKLKVLALGDLRVGDTLEARGVELRAPRTVRAASVQRLKPDGRAWLQGIVSAAGGASLVLLDETVSVTASTSYQDAKGARLDAATFFARAAGREVKARGVSSGTSFVADQLSFQN